MVSNVFMAGLDDMRTWADAIMSREPDFVIGDNYLRRWWVIPRNPWCNVYLHEIRKSDDDRALHDHPWDNTSLLLAGGYVEHTPEGAFDRSVGDIVQRRAEDLHRLEVRPGGSALSLFLTGPKVREWGFECLQGWVHWQDFTSPEDSSQIGRGCGEPGEPTPTQGRPVRDGDPVQPAVLAEREACLAVVAQFRARLQELAGDDPAGLVEAFALRMEIRRISVCEEGIAQGWHLPDEDEAVFVGEG